MKNKTRQTLSLYNKVLSTDYNYHKNYWIYLVSALALILVGIVMFAVLSFNFTFSFTGGKIINLEYGYTMTEQEYKTSEQTVKDILDKHNIKNYEVLKTTDIAENGNVDRYTYATMVQIVNTKQRPINETNLNSVVEELETTFKREQSSFKLTVTTSSAFAGDRVMTDFAIVFSILLIIAFVYMWIRFSFTATLASFIGLIFSIAMLAALSVITRVPTSEYFVAVMLGVLVLSMLYNLITFGNINQLLIMQEHENKTNNDFMNVARKRTTLIFTLISSMVFAVVVMLLIFGTNSIRFMALELLFGLISTVFVSTTIVPAIWVKLYNRKKDKHLQARQAKLEKAKAPKEPTPPTKETK